MLLVVRDGGDHPVARFDQGQVDEMVGPDGPMGDHDIGRAAAVVETGDQGSQPLASRDRPIGEVEVEELVPQPVGVVAGQVEQPGHGQRLDTGLGQVEVAAGLVVVHPLLDGKRFDPHVALLLTARSGQT